MSAPRDSLEQRFMDKVVKTETCWNWTAYIHRSGYGNMMVPTPEGPAKQRVMAAHRLSFELFVGPIPAGLMVCHRCDNRRCVNPAHLFLGTQRDNIQDCIRKGRFRAPLQPGEAHFKAKLTAEQAHAIRYHRGPWKYGEQTALARKLGVSPKTVSGVARGRNWRCLAPRAVGCG